MIFSIWYDCPHYAPTQLIDYLKNDLSYIWPDHAPIKFLKALQIFIVSVQFLWFQILTFDKVLIPTITHFPGNQDSPPSFPFISLLHTHQKTRRTRWILKCD